MRQFKSNNNDIKQITFKGIEYFFIIDSNGVGIRRKDKREPRPNEIEALTEYLFNEGWANKDDFEECEELERMI